jgi:hypothetical protein
VSREDSEYERVREEAGDILHGRGLDINKVATCYMLILSADSCGNEAFFEELARPGKRLSGDAAAAHSIKLRETFDA